MIRLVRAATVVTATVAGLAAPAIASAHNLTVVYESRLPLAVYLAGAAATVALSFIFVLARDIRAVRPDTSDPGGLPPAWLRWLLRAIGLLGWSWIVAQGIVGGSSDADVASLFLWVYGWVGVAMVSSILFPVWHWLDPFSTIYDIGAWLAARVGVASSSTSELPSILRGWPAVVGFVFFVWLELALDQGTGQQLFIILLGYTAFTLAMMAQFGRDEWRSNGETFSYWFRVVGRLAPLALVDEAGRVRRRTFASGLLEGGWTMPMVVIIALGVGSIIYDGLSQTQPFFDAFGAPAVGPETVLLGAFLGIIVGAALLVVRTIGVEPTAAGFLPIAVGYLFAHYLTYVLIDGQRIVIAVSDPLQRGWNLFGMAFYEPGGSWLPPGLVWTAQLAFVVGGHMLGAWAGHVTASWKLRAEGAGAAERSRALRLRQVPLAIVMVALTTITLWSLGQAIVREAPTGTGAPSAVVAAPEDAAEPG